MTRIVNILTAVLIGINMTYVVRMMFDSLFMPDRLFLIIALIFFSMFLVDDIIMGESNG